MIADVFLFFISMERKKEAMRAGGKHLAAVMMILADMVRDGVRADEIDARAEEEILVRGCRVAFKGYGDKDEAPFPAAICFSLNSEVVHGIPTAEKIIRDGDVVKIDIGLIFDGFYLDMARTFCVGSASPQAHKLVAVTKESLDRGIAAVHDGASLGDYARAVQAHVERNGFSVVRNLVGHGISTALHEEPHIPNYVSQNAQKIFFREGMTVALEPMVNAGGHETIIGEDGWTFSTKDGSLSAHFEDTILVTKNGAEILTRP